MDSDADNGLLVKRRRCRRRKNWSEAAEQHLVKLWARKINELRASRLNMHVYQAMSDEMRHRHGYDYSAIDIKVKLHNMTTKYRQSKSKIGTTPIDWSLYEEVHDIMERAKEITGMKEESGVGKTEKSNDFDFIESESFAQSSMDFLPEEHQIQPEVEQFEITPHYAYNNKKLKHIKQRHSANKEDSDTSAGLNANKRVKANAADGVGNRFLNKLANTVDDVVNFLIRTETEAGRNDAFYKVLESYMTQLPESTQDALKIEMLNTVFNKINEANVQANDSVNNESVNESNKISEEQV